MKSESSGNMVNIEKEIEEKFGGRLRTRVNGVLIQNDEILLIKHQMGADKYFWNVPGGGMEYGTSIVENLKREYLEETGLSIEVGRFLCTFEYLDPPLHAVELYFEVTQTGGKLIKGTDPELSSENQLITEICYLNIKKLTLIKNDDKHRLFWGIKSLNDVRMWKGYFNFENNFIK
jgi:ADP-ribose pyrophosphatase YjhB (NUDIX family)